MAIDMKHHNNALSLDFNRLRVVLVHTSHPGNIGAAARAMKNMCLTRLVLVKPKLFPHVDATARASGAADLLAKVQVSDSLDQAVHDCALVIGASARLRAIPWPMLDPRQCAAKLGEVLKAHSENQVALVLGREAAGLTNEELEHCNYLVHIPANSEYNSLNLAAAVQVLAYELYMQAYDGNTIHEDEPEFPPATADEMEALYDHLQQALEDINFLDPNNPRQLMRRLRRLFNRVELDKMELNILRGILSAAQSTKKATKLPPNQ